MRDYQRIKNNKYILPQAVYNQTIWFIRDYPRLCKEMDDILLQSANHPEGMPSGTATVKEVELKVEMREANLTKKIAIESALNHIPTEYQKGVWENVVYRKAYPHDAGKATYARWKSKFVYQVAVNMNFITNKKY